MIKKLSIILLVILSFSAIAASDTALPLPGQSKPAIVPSPPHVTAKAYLLMDTNSGKVLAEKDIHEQMAPASLTKMMTMYLVSDAIQNGSISLDDKVEISNKAWKADGARMFLKAGTFIPVIDIVQGIVVDSGNDACVAIAEHIAGSENAFVDLMNQQAAVLGMKNSNFINSTGMPHAEQYSTPHDMAILGHALIKDFPEDYKWYKQKWFTFNEIKQPNRNRLLWRTDFVDGIKTGHTEDAGYCLVASGEKNNMRLLSVVVGSQSDNARAEDSQRIFNWGFRFYESHRLYKAGEAVKQARIWKGKTKYIATTLSQDLFLTIPTGQYKNLQARVELADPIKAPVQKGQKLGDIKITLNNEEVVSEPLIATQEVLRGGMFKRFSDGASQMFHRVFQR